MNNLYHTNMMGKLARHVGLIGIAIGGAGVARTVSSIIAWNINDYMHANKAYQLPLYSRITIDFITLMGGIYTYQKYM
mgnify:FL=1